MDKTIILNKIKSYYGFKKDAELARLLGISPQTLSNWKARNTYDPQLIYTKCIEINPEWLLGGKGPIARNGYADIDNKTATVEEPQYGNLRNKIQNIPLFELKNSEGLKEILKKNSSVFISSLIKIPNVDKCDGAIHVKGDSMLPLLKSGDIILFKNISVDDILWGEMYLVEISLENKDKLLVIRHLHKSDAGEDFIKLVSENPTYETKDFPKDKIKSIALIRASVRFH